MSDDKEKSGLPAEPAAAADDAADAGGQAEAQPPGEAAGTPTAAEDGSAPVAEGQPAGEAAQPAPGTAEPGGQPAAPAADGAAPSAGGEAAAADPEREAKLKAAAEARAARAAAKAAAEGGAPAADGAAAGAVDPEKEAKVKAAAEARAARAAAKAAAEGDAAPAEPKPPSPMQPQLDLAVELVRTLAAEDAIDEAYINELDGHRPTLIIRGERLLATAKLLKTHAALQMNYMRNLSGVDYETHLEVVYHLVSLQSGNELAVKVKTDREAPSVPSVVPVWETANWNEREIYDLLGVNFPGHPDLRRIMMPDNWVGYPLRKDYEPLDPEV